MDQAERPQQGIQSIETGFELLAVLEEAEQPLSLKAIAERSGMASSKVHRYLVSLLRTGIVAQIAPSGRYTLGQRALRMGVAALERTDPVVEASHGLRSVVDREDQTGILAVWGERGPSIIRWLRSSKPVMVNLNLGSTLPVLTSSDARVFLAFMPPGVLQRTIENVLAQMEPQTAARFDLDKLYEQIEHVRRTRLARVEGGVVPGLRAASAPVFDAQGEPAASMSLIATVNADVERFERSVLVLHDTAKQVSQRLGYSEAASTSRDVSP